MTDRATSIRRPDLPDIARVANSSTEVLSVLSVTRVSLAIFGENSARLYKSSSGALSDEGLVFSDDGISGGEFRSHAEERHRRGIAGRSRMAHFGRGARATRGRPGAAQACASRPAFATCKSHTGWVDGLHRVAGAN